ncbi:hypothetical protein HJC23_013830 [Cyclotella cryptica]|uniref:Activator of Hsp90 ATPase homologue 1/2-like C-terminal domain-containing protein n=1 Tax=Cyclotella cryptica TaxID=29204 RepID=A0ABD3PBJ7_9STRA|eukprot:CCRYP_016078-RA/>CCRYP_016078-RA protein AED:0.33 eAED:0.33 QI:0/-1/0/1/-1/1/1/0/136
MKITIETKIQAPVDKVWSAWTTPDDIVKWNFASDEWCCPRAQIDLQPGGKFSYRMEAKDGSTWFDFAGEFIAIEENKRMEFHLGDNRSVVVNFEKSGDDTVTLSETFEAEEENSAEQQRRGWQSILDNFKKHVESD